jgi:DNA-binding CsgD family transcriptional regulator
VRTPDPALLEQLLNFTPAEAPLASALVAGKTVQEFAEEAGVSLNTTRTHLKRILSKAGVSRQAELIRQLTAMASYTKP